MKNASLRSAGDLHPSRRNCVPSRQSTRPPLNRPGRAPLNLTYLLNGRHGAAPESKTTMTKQEAIEYVRETDDTDADYETIRREVFPAIFGREPDADDEQEGLWSHCCAAVV